MSSVLSNTALPIVISGIVQTEDPEVQALAARIWAMDTDSLIELGGAAKAVIAAETEELEKRIAHDRLVVRIVEAIALKKILDSGGTALPHDMYDVHIEQSKTVQKDIATLRQLEGKLPEEELAPALYLEQPEPQWKADGTKLNALLRKYGEESEIGQIIRAGMQHVLGPARLVFQTRQPRLKRANGQF